ncbi:hypothetical protein CHS0354_027663 [Potamilus streckersoni]|uniref:Uncharacterized protein n=1 Tax=Potamilus streckersoni TaxID=2493646 RepID=A0AAE0T0G2_9BIVA|nr:hypothetical protein CHS0354_027663 [Potamilus streckersoni]
MEERNISKIIDSEFSGKQDGGLGIVWSDAQTLGDCLDKNVLPLIVKVGNQQSEHYVISDQGPLCILENSVMKITKRMLLKTALIKFKAQMKPALANRTVSEIEMKFVDDTDELGEAAKTIRGDTGEVIRAMDYVNEQVASDNAWLKTEFINVKPDVHKSDETGNDKTETSEVLIALAYRNKARILSKIPNGKQYTCISQVIDDFPRYIEVEDDLSLKMNDATYGNDDLCPIVPRGTVLELDRVLPGSHPGEKILECKYNFGEGLAFRSDQNIFCKAIPDQNLYNLQDIVDKVPLPQTFQFVDGNQDFAVLDVTTRNITKHGYFPMEIEIICVSNVNVLFAVVQIEKGGRSEFTTILIPAYNTFLQSMRVHLPKYARDDLLENLFPSKIEIENPVDVLFSKLSDNKPMICIAPLETSASERTVVTLESNPPPLPPKVSSKTDAADSEHGNNADTDELHEICEPHTSKDSKKRSRCTIL